MRNRNTKNKNANQGDYQVIEIDLEETINYFEEMLEETDDDTEDFKEYTKQLKLAKKLNKPYKVSTLKEYFSLLEKINNITDGQYHIYNNGTSIVDCY